MPATGKRALKNSDIVVCLLIARYPGIFSILQRCKRPLWNRHTAFSSPTGLLEFVAQLRELSGGKPVGFKLCIGYLQILYILFR